jgi:hypothetical protein
VQMLSPGLGNHSHPEPAPKILPVGALPFRRESQELDTHHRHPTRSRCAIPTGPEMVYLPLHELFLPEARFQISALDAGKRQ